MERGHYEHVPGLQMTDSRLRKAQSDAWDEKSEGPPISGSFYHNDVGLDSYQIQAKRVSSWPEHSSVSSWVLAVSLETSLDP